ncbi:MAG: hypothetical protein ACI8S6_000060 [Myxococcota bacterium]|jgi:hypothetical protein
MVATLERNEADQLMQAVSGVVLSERLRRAVDRYEQVGSRSPFLWKWVRNGVAITELSCVDPAWQERVSDMKTLGVMFDVLVDDVADGPPRPDFLGALFSISEGRPELHLSATEVERAYVGVAWEVWDGLWRELRTLPRFAEFRDLLAFDYAQLMNAMRYSALTAANPRLMNMAEHDAYLPHNMHMMINATIDLMASPRFDVADLGALRTSLLQAQHMGRIGNLVSTWEREVGEGDFSSGVFPMALETGLLSVEQLLSGNSEWLTWKIASSTIEAEFLARWGRHRRSLVAMADRIRSVDLLALVGGLETLLQLHLGSRGRK